MAIRNSLVRVVALAATSLASCNSDRPALGLDVPVASRWLFRGAVLNREAVIQPDLRASFEGEDRSLTLGVFTNFDVTDENDNGRQVTEVDPYLDLGTALGDLDVSCGVLFTLPHDLDNSTAELYAIAAHDFAGTTAALEAWWDFVDADGVYVNANLGREFTLAERWTLGASAGVGYMDDGQAEYYLGGTSGGFSDLQAQLALTYAVSDRQSLSLVTAFSTVVDGDLRDGVEDPDNVAIALGTSFSF